MSWKPRGRKWNWRAFLTADEADAILHTDMKINEAQSLMLDVKRSDRSLIINRAIQRAKYAANAR